MVDDGRTDDGRTDGRTTEHGYTISSPCEPDGSGELKSQKGRLVQWIVMFKKLLLRDLKLRLVLP